MEPCAGKLLRGLGFDSAGLAKKTKAMSGGWRMRVALAEALFVRPTLLMLDEPTNHLDLGSVVWLEEYLASYDKILIINSHSQVPVMLVGRMISSVRASIKFMVAVIRIVIAHR